MFVGGLIGCCYATVQMVLAAAASRWPTVEGVIADAYLVQRGVNPRDVSERVTYRYTVDGRSFVNDRVRIGPQPQRASIIPVSGHPLATSVVTHRYPIGHRVRVRYNPRRPQDSVLYPQPNLAVMIIFAAALVVLYLGARALFR